MQIVQALKTVGQDGFQADDGLFDVLLADGEQPAFGLLYQLFERFGFVLAQHRHIAAGDDQAAAEGLLGDNIGVLLHVRRRWDVVGQLRQVGWTANHVQEAGATQLVGQR